MKTILLTAGPIPGKLDSVKFITNRFKGGLMFKLAQELSRTHDLTIVKWKHTELPQHTNLLELRTIKIIDVDDVNDYFKKVTENEYDCYILGAAVANLVPKTPWEGKFPSHNYKVGDTIPIEFVIAPRVIDEIKKKYPRSLLIGYKLFDGTEEELMQAGWHTLTDSKANVVFCNHPAWAKDKKIAILPDGTRMLMTFDEHTNFIKRMLKLEWYRTEINETKTELPGREIAKLWLQLEKVVKKSEAIFSGYDFGTVAMRYKDGFVTTTRGKKPTPYFFTYVKDVDHDKRIVYSDEKATLNAPLLSKLFKSAPKDCNLIVHGHFRIDGAKDYPYLFPGTTEENQASEDMSFNVIGHGCYEVTKIV